MSDISHALQGWFGFLGAEAYEALPDDLPPNGTAPRNGTELSRSPSHHHLGAPGQGRAAPMVQVEVAETNGQRGRSASRTAATRASWQHEAAAGLAPGVGSGGAGSSGRRPRLEVEFRNLGLQLRLTRKWVLSGVTGKLRGELLAGAVLLCLAVGLVAFLLAWLLLSC